MDKNKTQNYKNQNNKEKRENRGKRCSKDNNIINTPRKKNIEDIPKPKSKKKKNFGKTISSEKLPMNARNEKSDREYTKNNPETEYKAKMPHKNKFKDNQDYENVYLKEDNNLKNYNQSKKIGQKYNKESRHNGKRNGRKASLDLKERFESKFAPKELLNTEYYNPINNKNENKDIDSFNKHNNPFSSIIFNNFSKDNNIQINLRSSSFRKKKSNLTYTQFIDNLKLQVENNENDKKHKKNKNMFGNFLNQFVNKSDRNDNRNDKNQTLSTITKYSFNVNNEIEHSNKKNTFTNIHLSNNINFCIESNGNSNNMEIYQYFNNEKLKMEKQLEIKENKIQELLKIIEKQKSDILRINNDYNNLINDNRKLKEEINNLKTNINNINNTNINNDINNNIDRDNSNYYKNNNSNNTNKQDNSKYNNLITYNINKNNNYNIINNEINNFNNFIEKNNNNINTIKNPIQERISLKEKIIDKDEQEKKERKERKASQAFERFRRINKQFTKPESEIQKSDKISNMAKMLEKQMGNMEDNNRNRQRSVDVYSKMDYEENNFNNNIVDLIDSQPVVNKKKRKNRAFSFDG